MTATTVAPAAAASAARSVSVARAFRFELVKQLAQWNVTEAQLRVTASCAKGSGLVAGVGPGNDWRCSVSWHLPGVNDAVGQAVYQLDVNANGRYVADGDGAERSERLLRGAHPVRDRTEPFVAVRRPR